VLGLVLAEGGPKLLLPAAVEPAEPPPLRAGQLLVRRLRAVPLGVTKRRAPDGASQTSLLSGEAGLSAVNDG
jgi:hypothetical protein